jgi:hypothetical protein
MVVAAMMAPQEEFRYVFSPLCRYDVRLGFL